MINLSLSLTLLFSKSMPFLGQRKWWRCIYPLWLFLFVFLFVYPAGEGRVIKVMMINLFLCLTLFSTYASRGPTRETSVFQWGSIHHLLSNSSFSMTYVMILFLSDYYCLFMLQGKAKDIISQGSQGQGPNQVYNQGTRWSEDFLLGPSSGHGRCWGS